MFDVNPGLTKPALILLALLALPAAMAQQTTFSDYRIGPSDVLSITVWQQPELSRTVAVRTDGFITYPLLGDMAVAGMTPTELRDEIARDLEAYVNIMLSEITVAVDEINSYTVSVLGEVKTPGRFSFQSQVTVLDVLAEAGGFTPFADTRDVMILRIENGETRRIEFDYRRVIRGRSSPEELTVYPGDIIMVP
ncbi:MAG: polysaccharide biosynthesis/export family protein [Pseudohongiella sp.]|uniref:polysaccharide biosynthesis/export family protein n=1 Tax=Pseudohongiella sp. TaxID=1979412 RepID=UPI0034A09071